MGLNINQKHEVANDVELALKQLKLTLLRLIEVTLNVSEKDPDVHRYVDGVLYAPTAKLAELRRILTEEYTKSIP